MADTGRTVKLDGAKLKARRIGHGFNAESLAAAADVSLKTVSNAEVGKSIIVANARSIADVFNIQIQDLLPESRVEISDGVIATDITTDGKLIVRIITTV